MWDPLQMSSDFDLIDVQSYVHNPIVSYIHTAITSMYAIDVTFAFSKCSFQKGWNLKYIKSGKNICTIYPKQGYLEILIVLSKKSDEEIFALSQQVNASFRDVLLAVKEFQNQRWLSFVVEDEEQIQDVLLILSYRLLPPAPKQII